MAKKNESVEEEVLEEEVVLAPTPSGKPRVDHDFGRADLNDLRDAVNELHAA